MIHTNPTAFKQNLSRSVPAYTLRAVLREAGRQRLVNTVIHWSPHNESRSWSRQDLLQLSVYGLQCISYRVYKTQPASFSQNCCQCVGTRTRFERVSFRQYGRLLQYSLTDILEHGKKVFGNDFEKRFTITHCLNDFDFQIIDMRDLDFKISQR